MKNLTITICLTLALLLGSTGTSWGADYQKGASAFKSRDYATAAREFRPLAEQGNVICQYYLGWMYEMGLGVIKDPAYAYMWFNIAAASCGAQQNHNALVCSQGMPSSGRDRVTKKMTPTQLEKAQELTRECVRKEYIGC